MNAPPSTACLVLVSCPEEATAERIARLVVERRLAACVTWQAGWKSVYRWEGKIETAGEVLWLAKTTQAHWEDLRDLIRQEHPYECPEILCWAIADGFPPYLAWLVRETESNGRTIP